MYVDPSLFGCLTDRSLNIIIFKVFIGYPDEPPVLHSGGFIEMHGEDARGSILWFEMVSRYKYPITEGGWHLQGHAAQVGFFSSVTKCK